MVPSLVWPPTLDDANRWKNPGVRSKSREESAKNACSRVSDGMGESSWG
jgi:hypothetical protein